MTASMTNERALSALALLIALAVASGCGDDGRAPFVGVDEEGGASSAGGAVTAGSGGTSGSGAGRGGSSSGSGGAAPGGAAGTGGTGGDTGWNPVPEPDVPALCAENMAASTPQRLAISTAAADVFAGITADELVLAWMTIEQGVSTLYTASRGDLDSDFSVPLEQTIATPDPVALGRDGLELVHVDADRHGFSLWTRAALDEAFARAPEQPFSLLFGEDPDAENERYADPVLSSNALTLFFARLDAGGRRTPFASVRISPAAPWGPSQPVALDEELEAAGDGRLQITGVSGDGRTLFLWNETRGSALTATLDRTTREFAAGSELGALGRGAPNADCSRLYHSSSRGTLDLHVSALR